jgi:hypothetical protein
LKLYEPVCQLGYRDDGGHITITLEHVAQSASKPDYSISQLQVDMNNVDNARHVQMIVGWETRSSHDDSGLSGAWKGDIAAG